MSQIARELDRLVPSQVSIDLFIDAEQLVGYDSDVRIAMTKWVSTNRLSLRSVHGLVRSKLVAMGAAVANLALGGFLTLYSERRGFEHALATVGGGQPDRAAAARKR